MAIAYINVEGYGPCRIESSAYHPEKETTECWCGADKQVKWVPFCFDCTESLPREISDRLHLQYDRGYEEAYQDAAAFLAQAKGYGDDLRTAAERIEAEQFDDVVTGLPDFLQELLTGQIVEKQIEGPADNVYANVFAGLPPELQDALLGE